MSDAMTVPVALLIVMGTIGALDGVWFHLVRYRLFAQPSSRAETVTHLVRGITFAASLWLLLHYRPLGAWFWAVAALFAIDLVDDIVDVALEPASRRPLGGLPPFEYLVHMVVMALSGAIWATFLVTGWAGRDAPSALAPLADGALPSWLRWDGIAMVLGAGALVAIEAFLLLRSAIASHRGDDRMSSNRL